MGNNILGPRIPGFSTTISVHDAKSTVLNVRGISIRAQSDSIPSETTL